MIIVFSFFTRVAYARKGTKHVKTQKIQPYQYLFNYMKTIKILYIYMYYKFRYTCKKVSLLNLWRPLFVFMESRYFHGIAIFVGKVMFVLMESRYFHGIAFFFSWYRHSWYRVVLRCFYGIEAL